MAREESDREDLLREATALVERVELRPLFKDADDPGQPGVVGTIFAGFRADGAFSVFFGHDPVYQFNADGELRRAYASGMLFKAAQGHLSSLERVRTASEVQLVRRELAGMDEAEFLEAMSQRLRQLESLLGGGDYTVIGAAPPAADVLGRVKAWLAANKHPVVAARPNV